MCTLKCVLSNINYCFELRYWKKARWFNIPLKVISWNRWSPQITSLHISFILSGLLWYTEHKLSSIAAIMNFSSIFRKILYFSIPNCTLSLADYHSFLDEIYGHSRTSSLYLSNLHSCMHAKLSVSCSYTLKWLCWAVDAMLLQLLKLKGVYNLAKMSNISWQRYTFPYFWREFSISFYDC